MRGFNALPPNIHRRSQTAGRHRPSGAGLCAAQEEGRELDGVLPVPQREDAVVLSQPRERDLLLFWLSQRRIGFHFCDGNRARRLS